MLEMSPAGSPRSASSDAIGAVKSRLVPPSSYSLVVVFATSPPWRQSIVNASVSRRQRTVLSKASRKSGFASPITVSARPATSSGWVTYAPTGSTFPSASTGTFPQIALLRYPAVTRLRPKEAPKLFGAAKGGTDGGRSTTRSRLRWKARCDVTVRSSPRTGTPVTPSSTPRFRSLPALMM